MSVVKSFFTVGFWTLVSRVFGFLRDIMLASVLGTSPVAQAFMVAFKLPNFFRRLFAEGAFNSAFVPMFSGALATDGQEKAVLFARQIMTWLVLVLVLFSTLMMLAMPWVMLLLAPGFVDDKPLYDLCVELTRITFPYLLCVSLVAMFSGILNSVGKFWVMASAPVILNACMLVAMMLKDRFLPTTAHTLSVSVFAAGVLQIIWVVWACHRAGIRVYPVKPVWNNEIREFLRRIGPGVLGAGVVQVNLWVDVIIASFIPNAVAYLYYTDRIVQLPLSIMGTAMAVALLPVLAKHVRAGDTPRAIQLQGRAVEMVLMLTMPALAALLVMGIPMTSVLFERGEFSSEDSRMTAFAIMGLGIGLPAFVMNKVYSSMFFAMGDTATPVRFAIHCMIYNVILNVTFMLILSHFNLVPHVGIVLATSLAAWINITMLRRKLFSLGYHTHTAQEVAHSRQRIAKIILSGIIMAGILAAGWYLLGDMMDATRPNIIRAAVLGLILGTGALGYLISVYSLGALHDDDIQMFKTAIKKRRNRG